jgi:hypothetical protein
LGCVNAKSNLCNLLAAANMLEPHKVARAGQRPPENHNTALIHPP